MERYNRDIRNFERETIRIQLFSYKIALEDGLDVGCGENRIAGTGVDMDNEVDAQIICEMHKIRDFLDEETQNFIIACHSLEHTDFVIDTLKGFYELLKPGRKLFICVPDGNWVTSKDLGDGDMKHRQIFTKMTLTKLVEFCGFKVDECKLIEKNSLYLEATK